MSQKPTYGDLLKGYFFDICANNHGGNQESKQANRATNKSRDRGTILAYLETVKDATCESVELALCMKHQTCSARFSELKMDGAIIPTVKRKTTSGCTAQAWALNK